MESSIEVPGLTAFALLWRLQLDVAATETAIKLRPPSRRKPLRVFSGNAQLTSSRVVGSRALAVIEGCLEFCVYPLKPSSTHKDQGRAVQDVIYDLARAVAQEARYTRVRKYGPYNDIRFREGFTHALLPPVRTTTTSQEDTRRYCFDYEVTVVDLNARSLQFPGIRKAIPLKGSTSVQLKGHTDHNIGVCVAVPRLSPLTSDIRDVFQSPQWSLQLTEMHETRQDALNVAHLEHLSAWLSEVSVKDQISTP
jgi:hypothetical protein